MINYWSIRPLLLDYTKTFYNKICVTFYSLGEIMGTNGRNKDVGCL